MAYMKWIYSMIVDGTYPEFKQSYETALNNNKEEFMWEHKPMRVTFAKYICILVDKHLMREYEDHLEEEEDHLEEDVDNLYL